jgi:hypothetical protein
MYSFIRSPLVEDSTSSMSVAVRLVARGGGVSPVSVVLRLDVERSLREGVRAGAGAGAASRLELRRAAGVVEV